MARKRGNDLKLLLGAAAADTWLVSENGFDFNVSADDIDASSKTDGDYGYNLAGLKNAEIPFSARYDTTGTLTYFDLLAWLNNNTEVFFMITSEVSGEKEISGKASLMGVNLSAQTNAAADVSGTLKLRGAPTVTTRV